MPENISADQLVGYEICIAGANSVYLWHKYDPCERPYIVPDETPANLADLIAAVRIHVKDFHDRL